MWLDLPGDLLSMLAFDGHGSARRFFWLCNCKHLSCRLFFSMIHLHQAAREALRWSKCRDLLDAGNVSGNWRREASPDVALDF